MLRMPSALIFNTFYVKLNNTRAIDFRITISLLVKELFILVWVVVNIKNNIVRGIGVITFKYENKWLEMTLEWMKQAN